MRTYIRMDQVTQSLGRLGKKATTARVLVEIDMHKGLTQEVILKVGTDSRLQQVVMKTHHWSAKNVRNSS